MLTLHYDLSSPRAAVAVLRLQALADAGAPIAFSGIDALGLAIPIPPTLDLLAELASCQDAARQRGLVMRRPSRQPPTFDAHLVGDLAERRGLGASWRLTCLRAYWGDDADLADRSVLTLLATDAGLEPGAVRARLDDGTARRELRGRMTALRGRGIGGVPVLDLDGALIPASLSDEDLRQLVEL